MSSLSSRIPTDDHVCHRTGVWMEGVGDGYTYEGGGVVWSCTVQRKASFFNCIVATCTCIISYNMGILSLSYTIITTVFGNDVCMEN